MPSLARLMGILNATPDSFSDGGTCIDPRTGVVAGLAMAAAGAQWIDVGGESTRPGADPVPADEQIRRVVPIIYGLRAGLRAAQVPCRISVDTTVSAVASAALKAGADGINDVSAGADPDMFRLAAQAGCTLFLMHMQGTPETMQDAPHYGNVVNEVGNYLAERVQAAISAGVELGNILCDPGIGFGKTLHHNLALLAALPALAHRIGTPLLVGISRKSFLATAAGVSLPAHERDPLSHVAHAHLAQHCALLRVHDVPGAAATLRLTGALTGGSHG